MYAAGSHETQHLETKKKAVAEPAMPTTKMTLNVATGPKRNVTGAKSWEEHPSVGHEVDAPGEVQEGGEEGILSVEQGVGGKPEEPRGLGEVTGTGGLDHVGRSVQPGGQVGHHCQQDVRDHDNHEQSDVAGRPV